MVKWIDDGLDSCCAADRQRKIWIDSNFGRIPSPLEYADKDNSGDQDEQVSLMQDRMLPDRWGSLHVHYFTYIPVLVRPTLFFSKKIAYQVHGAQAGEDDDRPSPDETLMLCKCAVPVSSSQSVSPAIAPLRRVLLDVTRTLLDVPLRHCVPADKCMPL